MSCSSHMYEKVLLWLTFNLLLVTLFDGLSKNQIVSVHFTHSVSLLFYRHLSYPFLSDSKMRSVMFSFSPPLVLLIVHFCIFRNNIVFFWRQGNTDPYRRHLRDLSSGIMMSSILFSSSLKVIPNSACFWHH